MKNLVIAVLLAILIVYSLGCIADSLMGLNIHFDSDLMSPLLSVVVAACIGVMLVLLGFVIAVSIFGVLAFVVGTVFVGVLIAGISVFWPAILLLLIVFWLVRDKKPVYN